MRRKRACVYRSSQTSRAQRATVTVRVGELIYPDITETEGGKEILFTRVCGIILTVWRSRLLDWSIEHIPEAAGACWQTVGDESLYSRFTFASHCCLFAQHRGYVMFAMSFCLLFVFGNVTYRVRADGTWCCSSQKMRLVFFSVYVTFKSDWTQSEEFGNV